MNITHKIAVAGVVLGLGASGLLLAQASADNATDPAPATAVTSPAPSVSTDGLAYQAATRAALVLLCHDASTDAQAELRFRSAVAAHPELAEGIGADCTLDTATP